MPSGAKKRKAAKKRKENQSNNASSASTQSHGGDDVKRQEEGSDGGEVSSPTSQDHHSHKNLLIEGKEEEIDKGKNILNLPLVEGVKIEDVEEKNIAVQEVNAVPVERGFRIEDDSDKKDGIFKHEETTWKSCNGSLSRSSSASSSSSSDDQSHVAKTSPASEDIAQVVDSVKVADSFGRKAETSNGVIIEEASESIVENVPVVTEKISLLGEKVEEAISSPAGNSAALSLVTSVLKETREKRLGFVEEEVGISTALKDAVVEQQLEASIPSVWNITAISDTKECVSPATDDQLTLSYNAPVSTAENGVDHEEDSGVTAPLLAPDPRPVHTTSWKSCCGLFEVFTGSGR